MCQGSNGKGSMGEAADRELGQVRSSGFSPSDFCQLPREQDKTKQQSPGRAVHAKKHCPLEDGVRFDAAYHEPIVCTLTGISIMIDRPDNGTNTGLFGQWGPLQPGGEYSAEHPPRPDNPRSLTSSQWWEEVGSWARQKEFQCREVF